MHKAKAVAILCMDFRFQEKIQNWLKDNGYLGHTDEISIAGASRDFITPVEDWHKDYVNLQLELSVKLHDPDEILIFDHQDCGGYAQDDTIPSGLDYEEDKKRHIEYATKVKELLEQKYPNKTIKMMYVPFDKPIEQLV